MITNWKVNNRKYNYYEKQFDASLILIATV